MDLNAELPAGEEADGEKKRAARVRVKSYSRGGLGYADNRRDVHAIRRFESDSLRECIVGISNKFNIEILNTTTVVPGVYSMLKK